MPSTPRGRDAATLLAVIVAIVLALAWLGSSDDAAPPVPAGLAVETILAVVPEEPAAPAAAVPQARGIEGKRGGGERAVRRAKQRPADRAAKRTRRGTAGEAGGQDPPATASAPSAGSGAATGSGVGGNGGAPAAPEFALE